MAKILIDTNKYLGFYQSERIASLIPVLKALREHILVTKQIVDEVDRNKYKEFCKALDEQTKLERLQLPEQLLPPCEDTERLKALLQEAEQKRKALDGSMRQTAADLKLKVATSTDHISESLRDLFGQPQEPTEEQLQRAKHRRSIGNPPGKQTDAIGDELNWEQFLDSANADPKVWIISADSDFLVALGDKKFALNPVLYRELCRRRPRDVFSFQDLATGIKHFTEQNNLTPAGLPSNEELKAIAKAEREAYRSSTAVSGFAGWSGIPAPSGSWPIQSGVSGFSGYSGYSGLGAAVQSTAGTTQPLFPLRTQDESGPE